MSTALWRAVLVQAIMDATSDPRNPHGEAGVIAIRVRDEARAWFRRAGRDFRTICGYVDLDPEKVRSKVLAVIERAEADGVKNLWRELGIGKKAKVRSKPKRASESLAYDGKTQSLEEWAGEVGIRAGTLRSRIRAGWSAERALTEKVGTSHGIGWRKSSSTPPGSQAPGAVADFAEEARDRRGSDAHDSAQTSFPHPESEPA